MTVFDIRACDFDSGLWLDESNCLRAFLEPRSDLIDAEASRGDGEREIAQPSPGRFDRVTLTLEPRSHRIHSRALIAIDESMVEDNALRERGRELERGLIEILRVESRKRTADR